MPVSRAIALPPLPSAAPRVQLYSSSPPRDAGLASQCAGRQGRTQPPQSGPALSTFFASWNPLTLPGYAELFGARHLDTALPPLVRGSNDELLASGQPSKHTNPESLLVTSRDFSEKVSTGATHEGPSADRSNLGLPPCCSERPRGACRKEFAKLETDDTSLEGITSPGGPGDISSHVEEGSFMTCVEGGVTIDVTHEPRAQPQGGAESLADEPEPVPPAFTTPLGAVDGILSVDEPAPERDVVVGGLEVDQAPCGSSQSKKKATTMKLTGFEYEGVSASTPLRWSPRRANRRQGSAGSQNNSCGNSDSGGGNGLLTTSPPTATKPPHQARAGRSGSRSHSGERRGVQQPAAAIEGCVIRDEEAISLSAKPPQVPYAGAESMARALRLSKVLRRCHKQLLQGNREIILCMQALTGMSHLLQSVIQGLGETDPSADVDDPCSTTPLPTEAFDIYVAVKNAEGRLLGCTSIAGPAQPLGVDGNEVNDALSWRVDCAPDASPGACGCRIAAPLAAVFLPLGPGGGKGRAAEHEALHSECVVLEVRGACAAGEEASEGGSSTEDLLLGVAMLTRAEMARHVTELAGAERRSAETPCIVSKPVRWDSGALLGAGLVPEAHVMLSIMLSASPCGNAVVVTNCRHRNLPRQPSPTRDTPARTERRDLCTGSSLQVGCSEDVAASCEDGGRLALRTTGAGPTRLHIAHYDGKAVWRARASVAGSTWSQLDSLRPDPHGKARFVVRSFLETSATEPSSRCCVHEQTAELDSSALCGGVAHFRSSASSGDEVRLWLHPQDTAFMSFSVEVTATSHCGVDFSFMGFARVSVREICRQLLVPIRLEVYPTPCTRGVSAAPAESDGFLTVCFTDAARGEAPSGAGATARAGESAPNPCPPATPAADHGCWRTMQVFVKGADNLLDCAAGDAFDVFGSPSPRVLVRVNDMLVFTLPCRRGTANPRWSRDDGQFCTTLTDGQVLRFEVQDVDELSIGDPIGIAAVTVQGIAPRTGEYKLPVLLNGQQYGTLTVELTTLLDRER